jgi:hypothetical protein
VIVAAGQVIATHVRATGKATMVLEPTHYLAVLGQKPGALDHSPVFRDWKLPACFGELRAELESQHGPVAGSRRFVRVLQLLGEHPMARVRQAIESCQNDQLPSAEAVIQRTRTLAAIAGAARADGLPSGSVAAPTVHVPRPDLNRFDQLLCDSAADSPVSVFFA